MFSTHPWVWTLKEEQLAPRKPAWKWWNSEPGHLQGFFWSDRSTPSCDVSSRTHLPVWTGTQPWPQCKYSRPEIPGPFIDLISSPCSAFRVLSELVSLIPSPESIPTTPGVGLVIYSLPTQLILQPNCLLGDRLSWSLVRDQTRLLCNSRNSKPMLSLQPEPVCICRRYCSKSETQRKGRDCLPARLFKNQDLRSALGQECCPIWK